MPDIYPLTIVADRYTGTYSGGTYTAWPLKTEDLPSEIESDDVSCSEFFNTYDKPYGVGNTPNDALMDLARKMQS